MGIKRFKLIKKKKAPSTAYNLGPFYKLTCNKTVNADNVTDAQLERMQR